MFHAVAFDSCAMGSYPYPSSYMTGGAARLPAWPVRAACAHLADAALEGDALLSALADAAGVFNNATGDAACYRLPADDEYDGIWDWQWCTQLFPQETYFAMAGGWSGAGDREDGAGGRVGSSSKDMFWHKPFNASFVEAHCARRFPGIEPPRWDWVAASVGGSARGFASAGNIVFSNGAMDPWSAGGVREDLAPTVEALMIAEGGHHTDLFFADPADPPSVVAARAAEMARVRLWVDEANK